MFESACVHRVLVKFKLVVRVDSVSEETEDVYSSVNWLGVRWTHKHKVLLLLFVLLAGSGKLIFRLLCNDSCMQTPMILLLIWVFQLPYATKTVGVVTGPKGVVPLTHPC